jgi:hypothetical protein
MSEEGEATSPATDWSGNCRLILRLFVSVWATIRCSFLRHPFDTENLMRGLLEPGR